MYDLSKGYTFVSKTASTDANNLSHTRYQQFYKGIKIEFGTLITHSKNGTVLSINGELYNANELVLNPTISKTTAFELAKASTNATKFLWENKEDAAIMEYQIPEGELVIFPISNSAEVKLAYKYDIYATEPVSREEIYIDANSGDVLFKNKIIKHADDIVSRQQDNIKANDFEALISGSAATRYSGTRPIETNLISGSYVLNDLTRGNGVFTYNSRRTPSYALTNFTDLDNNWIEYNNTNKDNVGLDAHWGAEKTYDFWKNIFNRNSYDNNNAAIKSFVNYRQSAGTAYSNANWNGSVMTYGDGTTNPFAALDVCGHEIGHAICSYTANLVYSSESGAMNEGYSDIWGACIEHYGRTGSMSGVPVANVWKIGEDLVSGGLRSMSNPNLKNNPSCYLGTFWATGPSDNYGVHTNSGVLNKWFYILTAGEAGTNNAPTPDTYNVTGIGLLKTAQIAYFAERDYLTPNATYADARNATLEVADNLYCSTSPEYIATANAWYAVNVGEQYVALSNDVSLKNVSKDVSVNCNKDLATSISFKNTGINSILNVNVSFNIDGGPNTNLTWNGNLSACSSQTFPLNIGTLAPGTHTLTVTTTTTGDGDSTNNTKAALIVVNNAGTVGTINTFENATDQLISIDDNGNSNSMWERGSIISKSVLTNTVAGSKVYATRLSGNYPDKTKSYLVSKCYDLTNYSSPKVEFDMAFDLEPNFDVLYVQYSNDFGNTWSILGTGITQDWYNHAGVPNSVDCQECVGGQWNGTNATKTHYSYNLTSANTILRFVMISDDAVNADGVIIDNFVISGTLATNQNTFDTFETFPNPTKGVIRLKISTLENVGVQLNDLSGRLIYQKTIDNKDGDFNKEIDFGQLTKGVYILNVESEGKKASKKLVIE
jgi:bacillolysin